MTETHVLITVDVETRANGGLPDQDIWGRLPGSPEAHGITRMMDMLETFGVRGTFYLNPYETARFGATDVAEAARTIHRRGHDLELHSHPLPMFDIRYVCQADQPGQREILARGMELIAEWSGKRVIAHRAGAYAADRATLRAAGELGLRVDSSFSPASIRGVPADAPAGNAPFELDGILEIPISFYVQAKLGRRRWLRYLDVEGSSLAEFRKVVRSFRDNRVAAVNIMMHSFSFVRYGRVDARLDRKFHDLLAFLVEEPGISVSTVEQFAAAWKPALRSSAGPDFAPYTGFWLSYSRAVEAYDKGWKNRLVASLPPGCLLLAYRYAKRWLGGPTARKTRAEMDGLQER